MGRLNFTYPTALVLQALSGGFHYGFDVMDATGLPSGTVYPILRRLEEAELLRSNWEGAAAAAREGRPPRRYYELTGAGAVAAREAVERFPPRARVLLPAGHPAPSAS